MLLWHWLLVSLDGAVLAAAVMAFPSMVRAIRLVVIAIVIAMTALLLSEFVARRVARLVVGS